MPNQEHLMLLRAGASAWRDWRWKHSDIAPDLREADLRGIDLFHSDLRRVNFGRANLQRADLRGANLTLAELNYADVQDANLTGVKLTSANANGANFSGSNLTDAHLVGANFNGARFHNANLSGADFRHAQLRHAELLGTNLTGALLADVDFDNAKTRATIFSDIDLSAVKGLETVRHSGPSFVGVETIYRSMGKIPESFLRGCGVSDGFITHMHALVESEAGIQFYSCFISYASQDEEFARRLHHGMREAHLRVWFSPEDIQGGKELSEQIDSAIRIFDKLLIVLSEASLESEWVMTELRKGRKAERQSGKRKLFPVRLVEMKTLQAWECIDPDTGEDLALTVRRYFIPDFSHWEENDRFNAAFGRLLKDLRSESA
jgi:hypothetical protein